MHPTASGEKKSKRKQQNAQKTQKRGQTREKTHEAHDKGRRTAGGRTRGPTAEPAQRGPATKTTPGRSGAQAAWPRRAWRSRTSHTTSGPGGDASPLRAAPSARRTRQPSPARRRWRRPVEDPCRRKNVGRIFGLWGNGAKVPRTCKAATNTRSNGCKTQESQEKPKSLPTGPTTCKTANCDKKLTSCLNNIEKPLKQLARQIFAKPWNSAGAEKTLPVPNDPKIFENPQKTLKARNLRGTSGDLRGTSGDLRGTSGEPPGTSGEPPGTSGEPPGNPQNLRGTSGEPPKAPGNLRNTHPSSGANGKIDFQCFFAKI